ncbi:hypothetical protein JCM19240_2897 [Vibrio maritimus]|uniref:Uncharacterized protein n=1 Tax=Vibrio maritimus TaxID=990268 RepID=A0A090TBZ5_9VIBR|nr:hypothetical protein JCM19240_2897 [Vibrio maritimus]
MKVHSKLVFNSSLFLGAGLMGILTMETAVRFLVVCAQWLQFLVS